MKYNLNVVNVSFYKDSINSHELNEKIFDWAEKNIKGEIFFGYNSFQKVFFNSDNIKNYPWLEHNVTSNLNTYELYFFGLRHIFILSKAYLLGNETKFINLAVEIFDSFNNEKEKIEKERKMFNNDHAIAERVENLIFLFLAINKANLLRKNEKLNSIAIEVITQLQVDLEKLESGKYYQKNHNHGMIVDKATLIGLVFLNSNLERINKVVARMKSQINFSVAVDGVHKENSIQYHIIVMRIIHCFCDLLKIIDHDFAQDLDCTLKKMNDFLIYAIKPDKKIPLLGDTMGYASSFQEKGYYHKKNIDIEVFGDERLKYIQSLNEGEKPNKKNIFFPSGYVFLREHFNANEFNKATWISFKAGYETRIHKHKDDLSFCLYSKGFDIFVDSGMYNYMYGNKYKNYFESINAHNTIGIEGISYSIAKNNGDKFKIITVEENEKYDYILASSRVYEGVVIHRHLYYLKNDIIVIKDEVKSDRKRSFIQYYNISPYVKINEISKNEFRGNIGDTKSKIQIKSISKPESSIIINGIEEKEISIISTGFGSFEEKQTLKFKKLMKNDSFVTVIKIITDEKNDDLKINKNKIVVNNETIFLKNTIKKPNRMPKIKIQNDIVTVINSEVNSKLLHAIYIYDAITFENIEKILYTEKKTISISNINSAKFILLYFLKNDYGEKEKGILAEISLGNKKKIFQPKKLLHYPLLLEKRYDIINYNTYRFVVNVDYYYLDKVKYSWWVYYNGSCIIYDNNNGEEFKLRVSDPGEYVVIVSVSDKIFGEFYFDEFDKIIVN